MCMMRKAISNSPVAAITILRPIDELSSSSRRDTNPVSRA